jgi:leucyl/phenylalanyl-tRNA--protein transferase
MTNDDTIITPDMLLAAYQNGYFPMAMTADDPELYWFSPDERGVLPIETFNIPRGLKRAMKKHPYRVTVNHCFERVMRGCASVTKGRNETWINEPIIALYTALHARGMAHSVEVWSGDSKEPRVASHGEPEPLGERGVAVAGRPPSNQRQLIGGLYGVSIGGAFFGESMFSLAPDASKIALVSLVDLLTEAGYQLLDTQYVNEHLKQFGVEAISKNHYMIKLEKALNASPNPSSLFSTASVRKGLASASNFNNTLPS